MPNILYAAVPEIVLLPASNVHWARILCINASLSRNFYLSVVRLLVAIKCKFFLPHSTNTIELTSFFRFNYQQRNFLTIGRLMNVIRVGGEFLIA